MHGLCGLVSKSSGAASRSCGIGSVVPVRSARALAPASLLAAAGAACLWATTRAQPLLLPLLTYTDVQLPALQLRKIIFDNFGEWGPIENVHIVPSKTLAFVR